MPPAWVEVSKRGTQTCKRDPFAQRIGVRKAASTEYSLALNHQEFDNSGHKEKDSKLKLRRGNPMGP